MTRLIDFGVLEARQPSGSSYWRIPLWSVLALEERRAEHDRLTAEWSRDLDAMGAPADPESGALFLDFFQRDRDGERKGIVRIDLEGLT